MARRTFHNRAPRAFNKLDKPGRLSHRVRKTTGWKPVPLEERGARNIVGLPPLLLMLLAMAALPQNSSMGLALRIFSQSAANGADIKEIATDSSNSIPIGDGTNGTVISLNNPLATPPYYGARGTVIASCTSAYAAAFSSVSDSTACNSGTSYASGGSTGCLLQCNTGGSSWKEAGVSAF